MNSDDYRIAGSSALQLIQTASQIPSRRLVTFAVLKSNWNQGLTYLDNFVPFANECLRTISGPATVEQIQQALFANFGIKMPHAAVKTIMRRVVRAKHATRQNDLYITLANSASDLQRLRDVRDFERSYTALVTKLRDYALQRFERDLPEEEAAAVLDQYVDEFGMPIVLRGAAAEVVFPQDVAISAPTMYIVHAFIEELAACDPATFAYLVKVVEGAMLFSVVFLPDLGAASRKFRDATAYLDTPFLLRALGYEGPEVEEPARELISLLKTHGVRVACFEHTQIEVSGVLNSVAQGLVKRTARGRGGVISYFAQKGLQPSDVFLLAVELEGNLRELGVEILPVPNYDRYSNLDEAALEQSLENGVRYSNIGTLRHDVKSVVAVYGIRGGRTQPILEHAKAIFVTTNTKIVDVVQRHFAGDQDPFGWPLVISDTNLATLVWLKEPMVAPELPRKQIMAECYAVLRPDAVHWDRWLDEVDRTDPKRFTPEQLEIIRFSPDVQRALMDKTFGDPDAVNQPTVAQVLEQAEAKIREPLAAELAILSDQNEQLRVLVEGQKRRADHSDERAQQAEATVATVVQAVRVQRERRMRTAEQRAVLATKRVKWFLYLVYGVFVSALYLGALIIDLHVIWRGIGAMIAVAGAFGLHFSLIVGSFSNWFEKWLTTRTNNRNGDDIPASGFCGDNP